MVKNTLLKVIGKQIAIARMRTGYTQGALSSTLGFHENKIAKMERGEVNITLETLEHICILCDCKIEIKIRKNINRKKLALEEEVF